MEQKKELRISEISLRVQMLYFVALITGILLNFIYPVRLFDRPAFTLIGIVLALIAPFVIAWAQSSSIRFRANKEAVSVSDFRIGPYRYTRHPTYFGVTLLMLGFGFIMHGFFIILLTGVAFLATYFHYRIKEERLLLARYGETYAEYKKKVRSWL